MVGLGDGGHGPAHADAVGPHGRHPVDAFGVQDGDPHRIRVLATQLEDVAGLDTADDPQGIATGGAGLAVQDAADV